MCTCVLSEECEGGCGEGGFLLQVEIPVFDVIVV